MSTGCILGQEEAYARLVTSRMPLTQYDPDVILPPDAERLAHIIREAWGPGWFQTIWAMMHPQAKLFMALVGPRDRGKSALFELLSVLGLAVMADSGVTSEVAGNGRPPQFSRIRPLLAQPYPIVVMDEVANQTAAMDAQTESTGGDVVFSANALKDLSAAAAVSYEEKHRQGTQTATVQGLMLFIANAPPLIDIRTPALGNRLLAICPPDEHPELALGALGRERILSPDVAQATLRLMLADAPSVWEIQDVPYHKATQDALVNDMVMRLDAVDERKKGGKNGKGGRRVK